MEASGDQAAQQHEKSAQQDQQNSSAQLLAVGVGVPAGLLAHSSVATDQEILLTLMQTSKQLQAEAKAECAGQLAVNVGLYAQQSPRVQGFATWLQRNAGLLRELHVELLCVGIDGSAVLQCLQEQQQQLQALQSLALDSDSDWYSNNLQDFWADPLLPHLPAGLRRLQLTGSRITAQGDALAALSRLQQLTQLTIGWRFELGIGASLSRSCIQLQHMPEGLRSLDLTCCEGWDSWRHPCPDGLAPLSRLQQLTELRLGKVQPQQLGQLPPALQQLDLTLCSSKEAHEKAAAWYQQHADIVRRLVLYGDHGGMHCHSTATTWMAAAAAAAAAAACNYLDGSSSSTSRKHPLQSLQVVRMPWLLDGETLGSLPASSLTELECSLDSGCERLVASLSGLTALHSLRIAYSGTKHSYFNSLIALPDTALAPLSALLQLTQLQLWRVRAQQLAHLQLPQLQQLRAIVARVYPITQDNPPHQLFDVSHLSSLTLLHINSCWMQDDGFPSSLREVTWEFSARESNNRGAAEIKLQPLLQLGALGKAHFIFKDLRPARLQQGLLHTLLNHRPLTWRFERESGEEVVWRMAASAAKQDAGGDVQPAVAAAADACWGAGPLESVRLMFDELPYGFASMPKATVQALGALQVTELAIHGGRFKGTHLRLEVTPAQLSEVLQRLPLLQRLELEFFALLCDDEAVGLADLPAQPVQKQQVCLQLRHSAAGVTALVSAIAQLFKLQALQLALPLLLSPERDMQEVESALERWLPHFYLLHQVSFGTSSPLYMLCRRVDWYK